MTRLPNARRARRWPGRALLVVAALAAPGSPTHGQGTKADYERAAALEQAVRDKVLNERLAITWRDDGRVVYWRELGEGRRKCVVVDPETGVRQPAFDHAQVASVLGAAVGRALDPERLPIARLDWSGDSIRVALEGDARAWSFDPADGTVRELSIDELNTLSPRRRTRPSVTRGGETAVVFVNRTAEPIELRWIDFEGRERSYGTVAPGASRRQHTFVGHVWRVTDAEGRGLGVFQAAADPGVAVVGTEPAADDEPAPLQRTDVVPSPDGRWEAFFKDGNLHLRRGDATNDELPTTQVTTDGTADDPYGGPVHWSPDSRHLVALRTRRGDDRRVQYVESSPRDQLQPRLHSYPYLKPGDRIPESRPVLIDVESWRALPIDEALFENVWSVSEFHWTPDSSRFLFLLNHRGHQLLQVVSVDAASAAATVVVEERSPTFIDYAGKLFLHHLDDRGELLWMSERDGWNHLYLVDSRTGAVKRQVTSGEWAVRRVERVDETKREVWFLAGGVRTGQDPYFLHACRAGIDDGSLVVLTEGNGTHEATPSPDGRWIVDRWSRVDRPPVTELRRAEDGSLVCELERADWSALLATGWTPPEPFVAKGRDGATDIYGVVWRPSNHDPTAHYPVVENVYAGPQSAYVPKAFQAWNGARSLAELGFIVVQVDGMGTSHRSKAFHDVCWKNLGDAGFPDRIAWIRAAAAKDPTMDLSRVGIYGGSAGGQNALRGLLVHGDFYRVGVADCGCHDNRMDKIWWNELWMGWPIGPEYEEQSNVTQAHRLTGKLLLIVGEMDENVDPASTMQVVDALVRADKDFDLLVIPGVGHGAAETPYGRRRRADFFVRNLMGAGAAGSH